MRRRAPLQEACPPPRLRRPSSENPVCPSSSTFSPGQIKKALADSLSRIDRTPLFVSSGGLLRHLICRTRRCVLPYPCLRKPYAMKHSHGNQTSTQNETSSRRTRAVQHQASRTTEEFRRIDELLRHLGDFQLAVH